MKSIFKFFSLGISVLYVLLLLALFELRAVLPVMPPWLNLLSSFAPFLFLPVPIVLLMALATRSRIATLFGIIPFVLFGITYGSLLIPHSPAILAENDKLLTVLTMNLGPGVANPERLAEEIDQSNADIVAVQEMTIESASVLRMRLQGKYSYLILDSAAHSTGLLSHYPIRVSEWFQPANEGRAALAADIDFNGLRANVIVPHPLPSDITWWQDRPPIPVGIDDTAQQRELADIAQRAQIIDKHVIIMGDLNISDQTRAYPILAANFKDAFRETVWGFGFTFPVNLRVQNLLSVDARFGALSIPGPWLRLDYIFHSDDIAAESAQVICRGGSDHCYLIARLRLK